MTKKDKANLEAKTIFENGKETLKQNDLDKAVWESFNMSRQNFGNKEYHLAFADALLKRGLKPMEDKDAEKAKKLYEKGKSCIELTRLDYWLEAALLGHLDSAEELRRDFIVAVSTTPEGKAMMKLLLDANYPKAWYDTGLNYEYGMGDCPQDKKKAMECYKKSAELGYEQASKTIENTIKNDKEDVIRLEKQKEFEKNNPPLKGAEKQKYEKELEQALLPLVKKATFFTFKETESAKAPVPAKQMFSSHAGGMPYFEEGDEWPYLNEDTPFEFIFQIFQNQDNTVALPQNIKLVQLFYDWEEEKEYIILSDKLNLSKATTIKSPKKQKLKYKEIELTTVDMLPEYDSLDNKEIVTLTQKIHPGHGWTVYNNLTDTLGYVKPVLDSYMGGYEVEFEDWRMERKQSKNHHNLFQLYLEDGEENHFGWGSWYDALLYAGFNIKTRKLSVFLRTNYD